MGIKIENSKNTPNMSFKKLEFQNIFNYEDVPVISGLINRTVLAPRATLLRLTNVVSSSSIVIVSVFITIHET